MAREVGLSCRILDEKELAKLKMGGILGVVRRQCHAAADDRPGVDGKNRQGEGRRGRQCKVKVKVK